MRGVMTFIWVLAAFVCIFWVLISACDPMVQKDTLVIALVCLTVSVCTVFGLFDVD